MSYVKPDQVVESMIQAGTAKSLLSIKQLLIRGFLFTGLALYLTQKKRATEPAAVPAAETQPSPSMAKHA